MTEYLPHGVLLIVGAVVVGIKLWEKLSPKENGRTLVTDVAETKTIAKQIQIDITKMDTTNRQQHKEFYTKLGAHETDIEVLKQTKADKTGG